VAAQERRNDCATLVHLGRRDSRLVSKRLIDLLAALFLFAPLVSSQIVVDTFAGGLIRSGVAAQDVALSNIKGLAWDAPGNLVFCDQSANVIRRIRLDGVIETVAGNGTTGFSGDGGPALQAALNMPANPRLDSNGNLYFIDSGNFRIRRIDKQGIVTTVAGDGVPFFTGMDLEGPAIQRSLGRVIDIAVDPAGNVYFTESQSDFVRRVTTAGRIEIFAGCSACTDGDGGPAAAAKINQPSLLALDGFGNLFLYEGRSPMSHIRRIRPDGTIEKFAGYGEPIFTAASDDGRPALDVFFPADLTAMAADGAGNVYLIQPEAAIPLYASPRIRRIDTNGILGTIAGGSIASCSPDGPALPSGIDPLGLAVDAHDNIAFADGCGISVREVTAQSMLQTLAAGSPQPAPDGTPARSAWFLKPVAIAFNGGGELYIAEAGPCLLRKIGVDGLLATVAGTGKCASTLPGKPSTTQDLAPPTAIAIDSQDRIFMADTFGNVYLITADGKITPASFPPVISPPFGLVIDAKDRVYLSSLESLFRVSPDGKSETIVAPSPPAAGPRLLEGLGIDPSRNVYFMGIYNGALLVFRVNDDGSYTQLYESPYTATGISGAPAVDASGSAWLGTRVVNASGSLELGFPFAGYSGDGGPAQSARFNTNGLAFSPHGDLYLLDNNRIRKLNGSGPALVPAIAPGGIVNAASYIGGGISPGELLSIFGSNFGVYGMGFGTTVLKVNAPENNRIPSVLVRTKVLFNGLPGAITALTPSQINVFAPSSLQPGTSVNVVVQVDATPSAPVSVPVVAAAPGVAAADERGSGQGAVLNQDGSLNSGANPAARGSIVSLYGTGEGAISPALPAGYLSISTPFSLPTHPVTVNIGGQPAEVIYAGEAPFEPAGVFQINVRIPATIAPGNAPVTVSIGGIATSKQITVAAR
jgi:uncharacterized protein (TIGR03437 family)